MPHKVLFVDDQPQVTDGLKRTLRKEPYELLSANSADEALGILAREPIDVVVSDEQMPGMSGSEFLAVVRQRYPDTIRMILTGQASLEATIRAINEGEIYRFFTKPSNGTDLALSIRQALQQKDLMAESRRLLKRFKTQSALLQELEEEHPGITDLETDHDGAIEIDDAAYDDCESLIAQMKLEMGKWE